MMVKLSATFTRIAGFRAALVSLLILTGACSRATTTAQTTPPPTVEATSAAAIPSAPEQANQPSASPEPSATAAATVLATVSPTAVQTPNPNLLSYARGAYIRTWSVGVSKSATAIVGGNAWEIDPTFAGSAYIVYELPAIATIDRLDLMATSPLTTMPGVVHVGLSTADPLVFRDAGAIAFSKSPAQQTFRGSLAGPFTARWVRLTVDRPKGTVLSIDSATAFGTVVVPHESYGGDWVYADDPYGRNDLVFANQKGTVNPATPPQNPTYVASTIETAGAFDGGACNFSRPLWHGSIVGGVATLGGRDLLTVVADGRLLVGTINGEQILAERTSHATKCNPDATGSGPEVAVIKRTPGNGGSESNGTLLPGHRFVTVFMPKFHAADLARAQAAMLAYDCDADTDLTAAQVKALLDFVTTGHVLTIRDSDFCGHSHYAFLPFAFNTSNAGGSGQAGHELAVADPSVLGTSDPADREHFIDTKAYVATIGQQIGDTSIMQTTDARWCGLLFSRNSKGSSGWVQAYARLGRGIVVFNGFDVDDLDRHIAQAERIARLDFALSPQTELPCSAEVAARLMIWSSVQTRVPAGAAKDLAFTFRVSQQYGLQPHHVRMTLSPAAAGGWATRIDRSTFDLAGAIQPVSVHIRVPANAAATHALYTLTATDETGEKAQASITIVSDQALSKALERGGRARIYGIHFDVASARIQPSSEQTIREIAAVLSSHPGWHMRIEGHTDSDGGVADNKALSERRAQAVVTRLTTVYRIGRTRLVAAGYGSTRPVASNTTAAGKALNRRVELVRI